MKKEEYLEVYDRWKAHFDAMSKEELQLLMLHRARMASTSLWDNFMESVITNLKEAAALSRKEATARKQKETKELNHGELH